MCLGADAKDEFNIVEVITGAPENGKGVPMATLHAKGMPMVIKTTKMYYYSSKEALFT